jgi:hypothetical protein
VVTAIHAKKIGFGFTALIRGFLDSGWDKVSSWQQQTRSSCAVRSQYTPRGMWVYSADLNYFFDPSKPEVTAAS